ncbi:MAG: FliK [Hyphomicrobiales bacterium]|nr:FliK [Hyphomicrobiales bacterium]
MTASLSGPNTVTFVSLNTSAPAQPTAVGPGTTQSAAAAPTDATAAGGFGTLLDQVAAALQDALGLPQSGVPATTDAKSAAAPNTTAPATQIDDVAAQVAAAQAAAVAAQGTVVPAKAQPFVPGLHSVDGGAVAAPNPPATAIPVTGTDSLAAAVAAQAAAGTQQSAAAGTQTASPNAAPASAYPQAPIANAPATNAQAPVIDPQAAPATVAANPVAGDQPATTPAPTSPLGTLSQSLAELEKNLADQKPVDPALLDKLNKALDAVAGMLGMPGQTPIVDPAKPVPTTTAPTTAGAAVTGLPAVTDPQALLASIGAQANDLAGKLAGKQADLAAKLQAVGQKLGSRDFTPDALTKLGLISAPPTSAETEFLATLKTQLSSGPVSTSSASAASAPAPFIAPQLKVPENSALAPAGAAKQDPATTPQGVQPTTPSTTPPATPVLDAHLSAKPKDTPAVTASDNKPAAPKASEAPAVAAHVAAATTTPNDAAAQASVQAVQASVQADPALSKAVPAAYAAVQGQVNLPQMAYEIIRHAQAGASHFQIRLDPPELGRIDVKMHVDNSGTLNAKMTVDRVETLDLLKRDSSTLERALSQAGLDSGSKTNLEFSLRQNPFGRQDGQNQGNSPQNFGQDPAATEDVAAIPLTTLYRGTTSASGLNIFV